MGHSDKYYRYKDWEYKSSGYKTGDLVKYKGNIFRADYWARSEPGKYPKPIEGWSLYDELYDKTSPNKKIKKSKIIAYLPTWRQAENFPYKNPKIYKSVTHIIISFLMFSNLSIGNLENKSIKNINIILPKIKKASRDLKIKKMIAIGGATDFAFLDLMTTIGNNPFNDLLENSSKVVYDFIFKNNLDGIDLDLECWWGEKGGKDQGGRMKKDGPHPAGKGLTLFAKRLRQLMPNKIISAAFPGTSWYGNNFDPEIHKFLNWIGLMTYDFTGSWNNSPVGPHSNLNKIFTQEFYEEQQHGNWPQNGYKNNPIISVEESFWYWTNPFYMNWQGPGMKIPRDKIVLGIPIYGYDFSHSKDTDDLTDEIPPGFKTIRYKDIIKKFPHAADNIHGNIQIKGKTPHPKFTNKSGFYNYKNNIYFDTPRIAIKKQNFAKNMGLQGIMVWELTKDTKDKNSILNSLYKNSGNPSRENIISIISQNLKAEEDFLKYAKDLSYKFEIAFDKKKNINILYGSAGVEFNENVFATISAEVRVSIIKIFSESNHPISEVSLDILTANAKATLGSYNGFELKVALIEGEVSVFDITLGYGISSGIGIEDDSTQVKLFGKGFSIGRKIGISVFDSSFALDLKNIFNDEQWETIQPILQTGIKIIFPKIKTLNLGIKLFTSFLKSGRTIIISIINFSLQDWQYMANYLKDGKFETHPHNILKRGKKINFAVKKKVGFYGVEGIVRFQMKKTKENLVFYFNNPYKGINKIGCQIFPNKGLDYFKLIKNSSKDSDVSHSWKTKELMSRYEIKGGNESQAVYQIIDRKLF